MSDLKAAEPIVSRQQTGSSLLFCALTAVIAFLAATPAAAQKAPELGYVFPPVVKAGSDTEVQLGGYDFTTDMQFFVHDQRVTLTPIAPLGESIVPPPPYWFGEKGRLTAFPIPREIRARIKTPRDLPAGPIRWQVANANGSSTTGVFLVSDRPEVIEERHRNESQILPSLPVGVSGRIGKIAEVDRYTLTAERDGPITVQLFARRLGANFNAIIEVRDQQGRRIADVADTEGLDAVLTFAAKKGASYTLSLHDLDFRGNRAFVYRLALTPGPLVLTSIPAAGQRGATQTMQFIGYGVASGQAKLESTVRKVTFPSDPSRDRLQYQLETEHGAAPRFSIQLSDGLEQSRRRKTDAASKLPIAVTAALGNSSASHSWAAKKGQIYRVDAQSQAIGADLDLAIRIQDASGKMLASNDDLAGTTDAGLEFKAPEDARYTCVVSDLAGRSERLNSVYRLVIRPQSPSFRLAAPQQLNVPIGGKAQLLVTANRLGGHSEAINLKLEGLPAGVTTATELLIPKGKKQLKIALQCAADSAAAAGFIRITGQCQDEPPQIAHALAAGNLCPRSPAATEVADVMLATTLSPAFSVELVDKNRQRAVHRGTTYPAPFIIKRDEGFQGEITLQMAARQGRHRQGIHGPQLPVPNGVEQVAYPCFMPQWLETDRTTRMVVLGVGQQRDPQGNVRQVTKLADARITMILEGALLRVAHRAGELSAAAGDTFEIPIELSRSPKLQTPVEIELVVPKELQGLLRTEPAKIKLAADQSNSLMAVQSVLDARLTGRWDLVIRATTKQNGKWIVAAQTDVSVEFKQ